MWVMAGDADLVARPELLAQLRGEGVDGAGGLWDVRGIVGAGKTVLLRAVERQAGKHDVAIWIDAQDLAPFAQDRGGIGAAVSPDDELRRISRVLSSAAAGRWENLRDADTGSATADELADQFRGGLSRLIRERAEMGGRVYVLIDNFDYVSKGPEEGGSVPEGPLVDWLLRLVSGLRGAVVIIARRVDGLDESALPGAAALNVGGLTGEQVRLYLVRRLGSQGAEITAGVFDFTEGHALAVGLTADLVSAEQRGGQPVDELMLQLGTGRDDPCTLQNRLLDRLLDSADKVLRDGLDCLWAVRRFDDSLLTRLLEKSGLEGQDRLADQLLRHSFVECRIPAGGPADKYYVVHEHVRQRAQERGSSVRLSRLAGVGRAYYQEKMAGVLDDYEGWFRYEDPAWQTLMREWLYLVAHLNGENERGDARVGIAELFLDAFWWFGNYVQFPFCEELLIDWAEMTAAREDEIGVAWGESLGELYQRYPKGWRRKASTEDWLAVRDCLADFLRNRPELSKKRLGPRAREEGKKSVRKVRALMDAFLADAERYLNSSSAKAAELLEEAHELFTQNDDQWDIAWVYFQRADTALGRGDLQAAVTIADDGWRALTEGEDDDQELVANFHRIHADAAWERDEPGLALDLYARAALHAYNFQVKVGKTEVSPLDEYTQAFLTEMHERTADRLAALHAAGDQPTIHEACARIRQFFAPYWRDMDAAGMAGLDGLAALLDERQANEAVRRLFPPPPVSADLHRHRTAYARAATSVLREMEDELDGPPGTPLPPAGSTE
jgi:hypothetical protein